MPVAAWLPPAEGSLVLVPPEVSTGGVVVPPEVSPVPAPPVEPLVAGELALLS
jgi:hypothetical protein